MADIVEGEWKDYVFKMVTPQDHELIFQFLNTYWYCDEMMGKYAGYDEDYIAQFEDVCRLALKEDLNFIAWHKPTNEIAALRLTFTNRKTAFSDSSKYKGIAFNRVMRVITRLKEEANIYEKYGIDFLASFLLASVATKHRGVGLATEMYRRSIALLRSKRFPLCKGTFSSPFTRKAAINLGFTEDARVYLKDCVDENGERDFKDAKDDDYTAIMSLRL